jgi:TPR repeat protein
MQQGQIIDGYLLRRRIGSGGFGEVWLCEPVLTPGLWKAFKWVPSSHQDKLGRELEALFRYQRAMLKHASLRLVRIEHANRNEYGLFYIMPLADGTENVLPDTDGWKPASLWHLMEQHKTKGTWFTAEEIVTVINYVLEGLQELSDLGLIHRDLKPENILFIQNIPVITDLSLLGEDLPNLTRRGTPGFAAPSWYLESGGHPDQFGAGATLFSLMTGNAPDKMGRSAYRWPPRGEKSLSKTERKQWLAMQQVVYRATHENPSERFRDFLAMRYALGHSSSTVSSLTKKRLRKEGVIGSLVLVTAIVFGVYFFKAQNQVKDIGTSLMKKNFSGVDDVFSTAMIEYDRTDRPRDLSLVSQLFHRGAKEGHAKAQNMLGFMYLLDGEDFDPQAAAPWFAKAAEQEDAAAQYNLGCCYFWGLGMEKNESLALSYFKLSSDQGFFPAHSALGFLYYTATPRIENLGDAMNLLRQAAENGRPEAIHLLSIVSKTGDGLPIDGKDSRLWSQKIATITYSPMQSCNAIWADERGTSSWRAANLIMVKKMSTEAQPNLLYEFDDAKVTRHKLGGRVSFKIESDNPELTEDRILRALEINRRAAALRNSDAELWMGKAYLTGKYMEFSPSDALPWLRRAAEQGNEQALPLIREALLKLAGRSSP